MSSVRQIRSHQLGVSISISLPLAKSMSRVASMSMSMVIRDSMGGDSSMASMSMMNGDSRMSVGRHSDCLTNDGAVALAGHLQAKRQCHSRIILMMMAMMAIVHSDEQF